jgi:hypothetical protein
LRSLAACPWIVLGAIMLVAAAIAIVFSVQITGYEPDEIGYTRLALTLAHAHAPITLDGLGSQRLNQLYPLLIAPLWGLFANPTAFRLTHIWNPLLMASTAIPTYLLARNVVRVRWAAYLAAALVAIAPWLTLSTAELTEVAAYPACAWALLAMQRALAAPNARRDLLALLAIAIASYARLQLILLAPVLVLAMLVHEFGYALATAHDEGSNGRRRALRASAVRVVRGHTPLVAAGGLGLLVGVPLLLSGALASALGFYGNTLGGATFNGATADLARSYIVFVALGLAALPAALTIGFAGDALLAPTSRAAHAFASLSAVVVIGLTLQVAEVSVRFNGATVQERYLFYIVPLLAVGMCAALLCSRHPVRVVLGGTIVLAALLASTHYQSQRTAFWYQASPGMTSFYDWIHPAFGGHNGPSADPGASSQALAGALLLAVGLLVAMLARRLPASNVLGGLAAVAIVFCATETVHALSQVVHGSAGGNGFASTSLRDVNWIDRAVPSDSSIQQVVSGVNSRDEANIEWEQSEFWNRSIDGAFSFEAFSDPALPTTGLTTDVNSGAIFVGQGGSINGHAAPPSPRYLVVPTQGFPVQPAGPVLARSPDGILALIRPALPLHAAWTLSGVTAAGWLGIAQPATLRIYTLHGTPGRCVTVGVTAALSSLTTSARELELSGPGINIHVRFAAGETRTIRARVCGQAAAVSVLQMSNRQSLTASDPLLTLQVRHVTVTAT